jgi:hypothetical protein
MVGVACAMLLPGAAQARSEHKHKDVDANLPKPVVKIALEKLGYHGRPTSALLLARTALLTVDFVDGQHVLLTYEYRRLLKRDADEDNQGRMVRAEVVDLASGMVVRQDDWRLHDASPYLWPMGGGKFLLRVGNVLFQVDGRTLEMKEFLRSDAPLWKVEADEGTGLLTLETVKEKHTAEEHAKLMEESLLSGGPAPAEDYELYGFEISTGKGLVHEPVTRKGTVVGNETMLLDEQRLREKQYAVSAVSLAEGETGARRKLLEVGSDCAPPLTMLGHDVAMVGICRQSQERVFGVRMDGTILWRQKDVRWTWPYMARTEAGNRFAVESVKVSWSAGPYDSLDERDMTAGKVEVYDVETGAEAFSTLLTPLYSTLHEVALSPDGMRLAAVRDGCLEVYDLPPVRKAAEPKADVKPGDAAASTVAKNK